MFTTSLQRLLQFLCLALFISGPLFSQHFLVLGGGLNLAFYQSDELDLFKQTYNAENVAGLTKSMTGIDKGAVGYRLQGGYRYFSRFYAGINGGWQRNAIRDGAAFGNGETRDLKFIFSSGLANIEIGKTLGDYFLGGVLEWGFQRDITIESSNSSRDTLRAASLDGNYSSDGLRTLHLGLSGGVLRGPAIISLTLLFPVTTSGDDQLLSDERPEKQSANTAVFPANIDEYVNQPTYSGLHSNISSFKILLTINMVLEL